MSELPASADFVVIGGGVVGLSIALELRRRHPAAPVVVVEKERACGMHASGRNSGVLHAGFYYSADSLKARLTVDGNRRLSAWCDEHAVPIRRSGKLVVARSERDHAALDELMHRGAANGVALEMVDEDDARRIDPHVVTCGRALWSPTTSVVSPRHVMAAMVTEAEHSDITICTSTAWRGSDGDRVETSAGTISAGYVVNAAGLFADRVAHAYGFGRDHCMLPFRGVYLYGNERAPALRVHAYPVPDLAMPFLGLHFTVTVDGRVKIGPTAMPSLWREGYDLAWLGRFVPRDLWEVASACGRMSLGDASFALHARGELRKMSRRHLVRTAGEMVRGVRLEDFTTWGKPGIRAQLYDRVRGELVMDFFYQGDGRSMHILNAVSPAFTCALSFAAHMVDAIEAVGANS